LEEYIPNKQVEYEDYLDNDKMLELVGQFANLHAVKLDEKIW